MSTFVSCWCLHEEQLGMIRSRHVDDGATRYGILVVYCCWPCTAAGHVRLGRGTRVLGPCRTARRQQQPAWLPHSTGRRTCRPGSRYSLTPCVPMQHLCASCRLTNAGHR